MTVQNALEEMKERAFAPAFQKYLFDTYKVLAQTDFSEEEKDHTGSPYKRQPVRKMIFTKDKIQKYKG